MNEIATVAISSALIGATWGLTFLVEKLLKPERLFYEKAGITSVLVPLVSRYRKQETSIRIVGSNGEYVHNNPYWANTLESWVIEGNRVSYLLINPSPTALTIFGSLKNKYPENFTLDIITTDTALKDEHTNDLVKKYEFFHFALFENPNQIWIEGHHPRKEDVAYNCEYVPPRDAVSDPRFNRFLSNFIQIQQFSRKAI